jgi:cytochrome c oxidase subunit 2
LKPLQAQIPTLADLLSAATPHARTVDLLFLVLLGVTLLVLVLLFFLLLRFAIHYRAGNRNANRDHREKKSWHWEVAWTVLTLLAFLALFFWGAQLYVELYGMPREAVTGYVVAQQWMWKIQHVSGQREINELHIPVGRTVRLIMSSQDVIHSFFIPAFRIKRDVVPGMTASIVFRPRKAGTFWLACAEYCGTDHSRMIGKVIVMEAADYATWLARQDVGDTLAAEGGKLFREAGCGGCHGQGATVRAPALEGLYGKNVPLGDGTFVLADDRYIRDAILKPRKEVRAGYEPLMPSFEGKLSEDELIRIVAYIKSLATEKDTP